jgi:hypothetical protein
VRQQLPNLQRTVPVVQILLRMQLLLAVLLASLLTLQLLEELW